MSRSVAIKTLNEDVKCCVCDKIGATVWVETDVKLYCLRYPIKDYVWRFYSIGDVL